MADAIERYMQAAQEILDQGSPVTSDEAISTAIAQVNATLAVAAAVSRVAFALENPPAG